MMIINDFHPNNVCEFFKWFGQNIKFEGVYLIFIHLFVIIGSVVIGKNGNGNVIQKSFDPLQCEFKDLSIDIWEWFKVT